MRDLWCTNCQINAPDEQETGDCIQCGESMWTSRAMAEAVTAARALRDILATATTEVRENALWELNICFGCLAPTPSYDQEPCCPRETIARESAQSLSAMLARAQDAVFDVQRNKMAPIFTKEG